jgi:hypothetical protein
MATTDPTAPPIVCDMTGAGDTPGERIAEYRRLFADALAGRERTGDGIRFRFAAGPGVDARVRDLAARERACCAFFTFDVTEHDGEVWWDARVPDDPASRQILDEMYHLPDTAPDDLDTLHRRFEGAGLTVVTQTDDAPT